MKNVFTPSSKSVLVPLGLMAAVSATDTDTVIRKKTYRLGMTTLIISNKEMKDIMKIVKFLEESDLLIKGASETIENEAKEQKNGFLDILFGTLAGTWLGKCYQVKVKEHE